MELPLDRCRSHSGHYSHQLDQTSTAAAATSYRGHGQQQQQPAVPSAAKRLGRTPSSPSVFFSKVKERIREKVYETSTEWPHMAAIVQERRQRAADAFEARMSIRRQKTVHATAGPVIDPDGGGEDHRGGRRGRIKSDQQAQHHKASPCSSCGSGHSGSSFDRERAKSAFRRRSISEDTYNRQPPGSSAQRPEERGGVVCSNDELRAMAFEHKLRRSPVAVKHPETGSSSLECCQESTMSCESLSNNSASSNPKLAMFRGDGALFPSTNSKDTPLPSVFPHSVSSTIQQHRDLCGNMNSGNGCPVSLTVTAAEDDERGCADVRREPADVATRRDSVVIREIVFDEHGQTWDIYGAEFDPEILGQAIQSHLEKIMRKRLVDETGAPDPSLCLCGDSANDCRPMCSDGERETTQRALGFFLRYLCSVARRK